MIAVAVLTSILFAAPAVLPQAHFAKAQKLFAQGKYRDALDEFTAASEAAPTEIPALWFDIGQCHRNLGHARQAVASFRRYLAIAPDAEDREQVLAMIVKLGGTVDDLKPAAPVVDPPAPVVEAPAPPPAIPAPAPVEVSPVNLALTAPPPPAPVIKKARWKLWVGLAGGLAAVAVGVGVGVGVGLQNVTTVAPMPPPMLGTAVTLDTRGH